MWVRTLSLLPRARFSCERCASSSSSAFSAVLSQASSSSSTCDKHDKSSRVSGLPVLTLSLTCSARKRLLHAAVGGAAEPYDDAPSVPSAAPPISHVPRLASSDFIHQHSDNPKELCRDFLATICDEIKSELNTTMPPLRELAHYLFDGKGKYVRPQIVFLLAIVANKTVRQEAGKDAASTPMINERQKSVCRIAEMIHTASLIHDDVIDGSGVRRGHPTIHSLWGESKAIITGDYILSVASRKNGISF